MKFFITSCLLILNLKLLELYVILLLSFLIGTNSVPCHYCCVHRLSYGYKYYKLIQLTSHKKIISRDVKFYETIFHLKTKNSLDTTTIFFNHLVTPNHSLCCLLRQHCCHTYSHKPNLS